MWLDVTLCMNMARGMRAFICMPQCLRVCSNTICMMCSLPWTCSIAEASVLPTLFSDVQVYVPSSCSLTRNKRRLLPLRISNLPMRKTAIMKDLTGEAWRKKNGRTNLHKGKNVCQWHKIMSFFPPVNQPVAGIASNQVWYLERSGTMCLSALR